MLVFMLNVFNQKAKCGLQLWLAAVTAARPVPELCDACKPWPWSVWSARGRDDTLLSKVECKPELVLVFVS